MSKTTVAIILIFIVATTGIIFYSFNLKSIKNLPKTQPQPAPTTSSVKTDSSLKALPVKDTSSVRWATVIYGFDGKITKVTDVVNSKKIDTNIKGADTSSFTIDKDTPIFIKYGLTSKDKEVSGSLEDLKVGQRAIFSLNYTANNINKDPFSFSKVSRVTIIVLSKSPASSKPTTPSPAPAKN